MLLLRYSGTRSRIHFVFGAAISLRLGCLRRRSAPCVLYGDRRITCVHGCCPRESSASAQQLGFGITGDVPVDLEWREVEVRMGLSIDTIYTPVHLKCECNRRCKSELRAFSVPSMSACGCAQASFRETCAWFIALASLAYRDRNDSY